jgi:hypothetical protein
MHRFPQKALVQVFVAARGQPYISSVIICSIFFLRQNDMSPGLMIFFPLHFGLGFDHKETTETH